MANMADRIITGPAFPETREEEADRTLRNTIFSPGVATALCLLFLLTIAAVPVAQHIVEIRRNAAAKAPLLPPQSWEAVRLLPTRAEVGSVRGWQDAMALLPPVSEIREYETTLEKQSVLSEWVLPPVQQALTGWLGAGNEQAYVGRDGWLMYRPDVEYLTGRGFLDPGHLRALPAGEEGATAAVQPDPVKALVRFNEQLALRGIRLIVVPVPVKPMRHPEQLSARYAGGVEGDSLQNPSYPRFLQEMNRAGIAVFDVTPILAAAEGAQFLATDTHWTPEAMERTAAALARFVRETGGLPERPESAYTRRVSDVANEGDIVTMLKLPPGQRFFPSQHVQIHQVRETDGSTPWRPRRDADILLLGDSFSNIYSLGGMGWGESAGFAEQLSYYLRRPLDAITVNAGGAYAARQKLWQEMRRGQDRLQGKRIVLYEFAMRDLSSGDWKLLELPDQQPVDRKEKP